MHEEIIDLVALRTPLPKIKFPTGRVLQIMEATALTERLYREHVADPADETKLRAVLTAMVPDATDEDWESCTDEDVQRIAEISAQKRLAAMRIVEARRKNDEAGSGAPTPMKTRRSRPSSRTTTSATSAPASPAPIPGPAATGP